MQRFLRLGDELKSFFAAFFFVLAPAQAHAADAKDSAKLCTIIVSQLADGYRSNLRETFEDALHFLNWDEFIAMRSNLKPIAQETKGHPNRKKIRRAAAEYEFDKALLGNPGRIDRLRKLSAEIDWDGQKNGQTSKSPFRYHAIVGVFESGDDVAIAKLRNQLIAFGSKNPKTLNNLFMDIIDQYVRKPGETEGDLLLWGTTPKNTRVAVEIARVIKEVGLPNLFDKLYDVESGLAEKQQIVLTLDLVESVYPFSTLNAIYRYRGFVRRAKPLISGVAAMALMRIHRNWLALNRANNADAPRPPLAYEKQFLSKHPFDADLDGMREALRGFTANIGARVIADRDAAHSEDSTTERLLETVGHLDRVMDLVSDLQKRNTAYQAVSKSAFPELTGLGAKNEYMAAATALDRAFHSLRVARFPHGHGPTVESLPTIKRVSPDLLLFSPKEVRKITGFRANRDPKDPLTLEEVEMLADWLRAVTEDTPHGRAWLIGRYEDAGFDFPDDIDLQSSNMQFAASIFNATQSGKGIRHFARFMSQVKSEHLMDRWNYDGKNAEDDIGFVKEPLKTQQIPHGNARKVFSPTERFAINRYLEGSYKGFRLSPAQRVRVGRWIEPFVGTTPEQRDAFLDHFLGVGGKRFIKAAVDFNTPSKTFSRDLVHALDAYPGINGESQATAAADLFHELVVLEKGVWPSSGLRD